MLSLFKNKNIESQFKEISIRGRMAFGIKCLEQYIKEQSLENKWLEKLNKVLWDFITSKDLRQWDNTISDLDPNNIVDTHPDNKASDYELLSEKEYYELKEYYSNIDDKLFLLIDLTIDIGTSNLYGGTGKYSKNTFESTMRIYNFAQSEIKNIPNVDKFKVSKYSEKSGWGNRIEKSAFE